MYISDSGMIAMIKLIKQHAYFW